MITMSAVADYWIAKITANVDDFYANRIDYAEFDKRARAIYAQVPASAMDEVRSKIGKMSAPVASAVRMAKFRDGQRVKVTGASQNAARYVNEVGEVVGFEPLGGLSSGEPGYFVSIGGSSRWIAESDLTAMSAVRMANDITGAPVSVGDRLKVRAAGGVPERTGIVESIDSLGWAQLRMEPTGDPSRSNIDQLPMKVLVRESTKMSSLSAPCPGCRAPMPVVFGSVARHVNARTGVTCAGYGHKVNK